MKKKTGKKIKNVVTLKNGKSYVGNVNLTSDSNGNFGTVNVLVANEDINSFRKYDKFEVELVVKNLTINEWEGIQTPQCIIDKYEIHLINETNENWLDCF